jgi:acetylornithine deacetylase/succinyl-diaminopimelate desuccinylase-like protein
MSGKRQRLALLLTVFIPLSCALSAAEAQTALLSAPVTNAHMAEYENLAVQWLQEYLRVDTTNPPGNEMRAAAFLKAILDQEGIENRVFEYAPGRADLWARLPANTTPVERPLILLNHMDVVTSEPSHWQVPPFSGAVLSDSIYGRGAQDMKDEGLAQLMVMVMLKREKVRLRRDVIFLAVSDEEVDGTGTDWFIGHQRELLENAEFLINEGGENVEENGKAKFVGVDVGEKTAYWLHVVAHGRPGHGSRPNPDSAPNRLVAALQRVIAYRTPVTVLPVTEDFFRALAPYQTGARVAEYRDIRKALQDPVVLNQVESDESLNFLIRNTVSLTMLGGSDQTNVIPPDAWANLDVRLLPGEDPKVFLQKIKAVINDPKVDVMPLKEEFRIANYSPTDTLLYRSIEEVSRVYFPSAPVVPRLTSGYNECQRYRPLGINSYGFTPYMATEEEGSTEHGNDERIRVSQVKSGFRVLYDVVGAVAAEQ